MKVLFAVSNENISESIIKKYQSIYKEIIVSKNVYYFNAILKELQKDKSYDRIVISEDLEPFTNKNYETIDNFIFEKLDKISDEATTNSGEDIPIILIATDRRTKDDEILSKIFGIGVYSTLIGQDRSIDEVCKLINKPRSKKEAKLYYKIDANEIDYKAESEDEVSEVEIQNILTHYKRLGKNEEKYVESFNSIAMQYSDEQLRVIIKFLPLSVKAVLEAECPKYQQIMAFSGESSNLRNQKPYSSSQINPRTKKERSTDKAITDNGITIESIGSSDAKKLTRPVIIPEMSTKAIVKKVRKEENVEENRIEEIEENIQMPEIVEKEVVEPVKKGRGRPRKVQTVEEQPVQVAKKRRGRPKKVQEEVKEETILPGFEKLVDDDNNIESLQIEESVLPGFENEEENVLPGFENEQESILPGFENVEESNINPSFGEMNETKENYRNNTTDLVNNGATRNDVESLLTSDKKIVAFVGTTKNGTSFLVNNLAELLSTQGVKTAILDLTKNRNAYYIYTKNEEELRKRAFECTNKLLDGLAEGVPVNKNLDVYTSLPGENNNITDCNAILSTLLENYSLILLDCDFTTDYEYLRKASEIYLVQSMDVLTIQPLTAYLRDLKAKGALEQEKLRIVINKYIKVRTVTERTIIGGMAFYNDPSMSFMTELFNRETIRYSIIPFETQVYSKYLEGLINCSITTNEYPKEFVASLKKLAGMVYPLITNTQNRYNNPKYNKYAKM